MAEPGHGAWVGLATLLYGVPLLGALFLASPLAPPPPPDEADPAAERATARLLAFAVPLEPERALQQDEPEHEIVAEEEPPPEEPAPVHPVEPAPPASSDAPEPPAAEVPAPAAAPTSRPVAVGRPTTLRRLPAATRVGNPGDVGAPHARPTRARRSCDTPHPNVRVGADGIVEIDQSLVDRYTADLGSFMQLGFSQPYDEEGIEGWYIAGFSCTSPVFKAGFRRGDVLLSVNGRKTRSWVGVYMMYQKLKRDDAFEVSLVRKGEPITLRFRVVPGQEALGPPPVPVPVPMPVPVPPHPS